MQLSFRLAAAAALIPLSFACKNEGQKAANLAPPPAKPAQAASKPAQATSQPAAAANAGSQAPFSGLIKLDEKVDAKSVGEKDVMFIMARRADNNQLIAVQRVSNIKFPQRYEMGPKNVMMPGIPFTGPFKVSARIDRDGDPMTKGVDDLYAGFQGTADAGQNGVHLVLKKLPPGVKPAPPKPMAPPSHPKKKMPSSKPASKPAK